MVFKEYHIADKRRLRHVHPVTGKVSYHAGMDLVKRKGGKNAPIEAFTAGTVLYAKWGDKGTGVGGYGNTVVIRDKNGSAHVYAHLDSVAVKVGQTVARGQKIGNQGATPKENVTGEHLHYEVRKKSSPSLGWQENMEKAAYDPATYLKNFVHEDKIAEDGYWGHETTKALQSYFKAQGYSIIVDGKISGQPNNLSVRNIPSAEIGKGGSMLIKAMQRFYNSSSVDGIIGSDKTAKSSLVRAMQKKYGMKAVDGIIGGKNTKKSAVVEELQRRLNRGSL